LKRARGAGGSRRPGRPSSLRSGARRAPAFDTRRFGHALRRLRAALRGTSAPVVSLIAEAERDPFKVLISTILSARTKDEVTGAASARLIAAAPDAATLAGLAERRIEKLIFPVGFYRTKARSVRATARALLDRFDGAVPDAIEELVTLPGVGRKTANLVLTEGFRKPAICVDTHVHRIANLWGYVDTAHPEETEMALRAKLPRRHWIDLNKTLVTFGQTVCVPLSPRCSQCPVEEWCPKLGVTRSR
jgi:endonuclease III